MRLQISYTAILSWQSMHLVSSTERYLFLKNINMTFMRTQRIEIVQNRLKFCLSVFVRRWHKNPRTNPSLLKCNLILNVLYIFQSPLFQLKHHRPTITRNHCQWFNRFSSQICYIPNRFYSLKFEFFHPKREPLSHSSS